MTDADPGPDVPDGAPLAIVGVGCLFPGADGLSAYWANIRERVDGITAVPPTHWRPEDYHDPDPRAADRVYAARGGFLPSVPFSPAAFGIAPNDLEAIDTAQLLGLLVAQQALADAGYASGGRPLDRSRVGVILGVTGTLELVIPLGARLGHPLWRRALREAGVADAVADDVVRRIADGYVGWQENSFPGLLGNVVAGRIANRFDLGGTNCVVDAACASSLAALHLAALELQSGRADLVLTGGVDTFNDVFMYMCFSKTPALSPTGDARPFAADADGTILGEGLGVAALKRLADARRDGDRIYAVVRGLGSSSDGKGDAVYAPKAAGQAEALRRAYRAAAVSPATVELVEAHGTGTRVGDAAEAAALAEVYREARGDGTWCALGSVKSQIGHTKAAAGAAGLIKAAAALYHKVLPPTAKVTRPAEALRPGRTPFYVNADKRPWMPSAAHPRRAAVSAFGFGGSNYHCVLEEADPAKPVVDWDGDVQIVAFAADDPTELRERLDRWPSETERSCASGRPGRGPSGGRGGGIGSPWCCAGGGDDLAGRLASARALLEEKATPRAVEGVFHGRGPRPGKLAVLFPGQGAQYVGMLRDLACAFPALFDALAEADRACADGRRLTDLIYPQTLFTPEERRGAEAALRATAWAQPALGAVGLGAWRVLEGLGVRADAAAGHSYGELTALCAAGRLSAGELFALSRLRGRLMAEAGADIGDPGAMLAVFAPQDAVAETLRTEKLDLVLANKNGPAQTVLSGPTASVERAEAAFAARGVRWQRLAVAAAFHSPLVAAAAAPLHAALEATALPPGAIPVYADSTAERYPDDPAAARALLAGQLARPVEFAALVERMHRDGVRTFLEVGPGMKLTGLVADILRDRDHEARSLDASAGRRGGMLDLAECLAWLAASGHDVRLAAWDDGPRPAPPPADGRRPALTVPLCGANYVKPKPQRPPSAYPSAADRAGRPEERNASVA